MKKVVKNKKVVIGVMVAAFALAIFEFVSHMSNTSALPNNNVTESATR